MISRIWPPTLQSSEFAYLAYGLLYVDQYVDDHDQFPEDNCFKMKSSDQILHAQ